MDSIVTNVETRGGKVMAKREVTVKVEKSRGRRKPVKEWTLVQVLNCLQNLSKPPPGRDAHYFGEVCGLPNVH
jgi:hypothetical protein